MSEAQDKRIVSVPYKVVQGSLNDLKETFGAMTARVGLIKAIFVDGADLAAGCAEKITTKSVKGHNRTRVIGKGSKAIAQTTYDIAVYPRKNVSLSKGGEEYRILIDGHWWAFRVSGRQSDFHAFLCQSKDKLKLDVYYKTQAGASYFVNRKEGE